MTILICNRCKSQKDISCFSNEKRNVANHGKRYQCKSCDSESNRKWCENLSSEGKKKLYANNRKYYEGSIKGRVIMLFNSIKQRCKKNGHKIEIDANFIENKLQKGKCEVTGIVFTNIKSERGGITPFSPSVDRINSKIGYAKENIQCITLVKRVMMKLISLQCVWL